MDLLKELSLSKLKKGDFDEKDEKILLVENDTTFSE